MRGILGQLVEQESQLTVVDMEASIEHMSRGTPRYTDVLLIVTEPYYRSLETAGRIAALAQELGIPEMYVVANKVRGARDEEALRQYCIERGLALVAVLPFDEAVLEADESRVPILDADPESAYVRVVKQLLEKLPVEVVKQAH